MNDVYLLTEWSQSCEETIGVFDSLNTAKAGISGMTWVQIADEIWRGEKVQSKMDGLAVSEFQIKRVPFGLVFL